MAKMVPDPPLSDVVTKLYIIGSGRRTPRPAARRLLRYTGAYIRAGKLEKAGTGSWNGRDELEIMSIKN